MEELDPSTPLPEKSVVCIKCGNPEILKDYPNALCYECREHLIKFPIPLWVKLFGAAVLIMMAVSLINFPKQLGIGIHLVRGQQANAHKEYVTAQDELEKVLKDAPVSVEAKANMMIAAFYNLDMPRFSQVASDLQNKNVDDEELLNQLNDVAYKASSYYPSDSFNTVMESYPKDSIPNAAYEKYLKDHAFDIYSLITYASQLYDKKDFSMSDSFLNVISSIDAQYMPALMLKVNVKRELQQYDSATYYCNKLLEINHQFAFALSAKVRVLLKQNQPRKALELALANHQLNRKDGYTTATLALTYHFNQKMKERDDLIAHSRTDTATAYFMEYVSAVINGKEKF